MVGYPDAELRIALLRLPGAAGRAPGHHIELLEYRRAAREPGATRSTYIPGNGHVAFMVEDLDATYAELRAKGVRFKSAPGRDHTWSEPRAPRASTSSIPTTSRWSSCSPRRGHDEHLDLFRLDGQTAVVVGGAGGLGAAIARGLAEAGAAVAIADSNAGRPSWSPTGCWRRAGGPLAVAVDVADAGERRGAWPRRSSHASAPSTSSSTAPASRTGARPRSFPRPSGTA